MTAYKLSTHGLYILSGLPGSGKSTWVNTALNLPPSAVLSTDSIREQLFGVREILDHSTSPSQIKESLFQGRDNAVFSILETALIQRMREKMVTVVDATNTTDGDRARWAKIARDAGVPSTVLLFDVAEDILIQRDSIRPRKVGEDVIRKFAKQLQKNSSLPLISIQPGDTFTFEPPTLPRADIDIVGDIHGLYDDLLVLTSKLGYTVDENNIFQHPAGRKILFLGDWLDRGQKSMECFRLVHNSCVSGGHFAVMGNHEHKVWRTFNTWSTEKKYVPVSFGSAETMVSLWKTVDPTLLKSWMQWMVELPPFYQYQRLLFCHADVRSIDTFNMPFSTLLYGESGFGLVDTDAEFSIWSERTGSNGPILIRGHIPPTTPNASRAFSLERKVGFNGVMMAMPMDKMLQEIANGRTPAEAVSATTISLQTTFDFTAHQEKALAISKALQELVTNNKLTSEREKSHGLVIYSKPIYGNHGNKKMKKNELDELHRLEKEKLVTHKSNESGMGIYKYAKKVFFNNLWGESEMLLHARGLVLDPSGKIVQNPFVKVFNYGERDAGLDLTEDTRVEAVEKMNGFLGCVTKHPFIPDELLVTTTGSFDSDFVGYINDFISAKLKKKFLEHFKTHDETLMFEVIHAKDPHIISYKPHELGLYLIGAREKLLDSPLVSERNLDVMAKTLGLKRPKHYKTTLGSLRKRVDTVQHEGYMVLDINTGVPLVKWKSVHYLTVKFIGRMGLGQMKLMFEKPEFFKQKVDEEYYGLVDQITKNSTFETFSAMKPDVRVPFVRELVHKMWDEMKTHKEQNPSPASEHLVLKRKAAP